MMIALLVWTAAPPAGQPPDVPETTLSAPAESAAQPDMPQEESNAPIPESPAPADSVPEESAPEIPAKTPDGAVRVSIRASPLKIREIAADPHSAYFSSALRIVVTFDIEAAYDESDSAPLIPADEPAGPAETPDQPQASEPSEPGPDM